jgi:hypothetical protein
MMEVAATPRGFALAPRDGRDVVVLVPPIDGEQASLLALLADGAVWSTSALALALGDSQRTSSARSSILNPPGRSVRSAAHARSVGWPRR